MDIDFDRTKMINRSGNSGVSVRLLAVTPSVFVRIAVNGNGGRRYLVPTAPQDFIINLRVADGNLIVQVFLSVPPSIGDNVRNISDKVML